MKQTLFLFAFAALAACADAQSKNKNFNPVFSTSEGAIRGYDPVAYFTDGKPLKGQKDITYDWGGGTWHFASTAHRDSFQLAPEKYTPEYGGYCAYGWSRGYPAEIDPKAWTIVDDKLYLNYDAGVKADWDKKQPEYIKKADANWTEALRKQEGKN
jgi:YHS domain-containing protein